MIANTTNPMKMKWLSRGVALAAVAGALVCGPAGPALGADSQVEAAKTIRVYKKVEPGFGGLLAKAAGYAVFPEVGKGGFAVGGAYGKGILFEKGEAVGRTTLTQVTVGAQLGGQTYSEIVLFDTEDALAQFKSGSFALAAQTSAIALKSGVSATAAYRDGVAVFTATKTGLMFEASIGGQKFGYEAFVKKS